MWVSVTEFEAAAFECLEKRLLRFFVARLLFVQYAPFVHELQTGAMVWAQLALSTFKAGQARILLPHRAAFGSRFAESRKIPSATKDPFNFFVIDIHYVLNSTDFLRIGRQGRYVIPGDMFEREFSATGHQLP